MQDNLLVSIAGILLSLAFGYIPGLRNWYDRQTGPAKAGVMLLLTALSALGVYLAACYTPWQAVACSEEGVWQIVELFITAVVVNQAAYLTAVRPVKASGPPPGAETFNG